MTTSFPPGTSLWMAPLYFLGQATSFLFDKFLPDVAYDPRLFFAPFYVTLLNTFFCAGTCAVFYRIGRQLNYPRQDALLAVLFLGLGTLLWPYSKFSYSEPQAAFFLTSAFSLLLRTMPDFKRIPAMLSAVCLSLAILTKYETVMLAPVFITGLMQGCRNAAKKQVRGGMLSYFLILSACILLIALWNQIRFGTAFEIGRYRFLEQNTFSQRIAIGGGLSVCFLLVLFFKRAFLEALKTKRRLAVLLLIVFIALLFFIEPRIFRNTILIFASPGKSLFLFSPGLLAALFLFRRFYARHCGGAVFIAAVFLVYMLFLPVNIYNTAWQWGPRYFVPLLPFLMLPVLELGSAAKGRIMIQAAAAIFFAAAVVVQIIAVAVSYPDTFNYTAQKIARDSGVELTDYVIEKRTVFPKLLSDWRYAPLKMQMQVAASVAGRKLEALEEPLAFKQNVKNPEDWCFDFWWVYLYYYKVSAGILASALALLLFTAGGCLTRFRRAGFE